MAERGTIWKTPEKTGIDWQKLRAAGLPLHGTKFPLHAEGIWTVEGWKLWLFSAAEGVHTPKSRLFVWCDCDKLVKAGLYGQHYNACKEVVRS